MRPEFAAGIAAHLRDPGRPWILPRLIPALVLALPSLAFPVLVGWLVKTYYNE